MMKNISLKIEAYESAEERSEMTRDKSYISSGERCGRQETTSRKQFKYSSKTFIV